MCWCKGHFKLYVTLSNCIIILLNVGFDSFVGEIIREIDGMLEVKYRFCSSGNGKYFRCQFHQQLTQCTFYYKMICFRGKKNLEIIFLDTETSSHRTCSITSVKSMMRYTNVSSCQKLIYQAHIKLGNTGQVG